MNHASRWVLTACKSLLFRPCAYAICPYSTALDQQERYKGSHEDLPFSLFPSCEIPTLLKSFITTTTANRIINHKPKIMIFTTLVALLSIASLATTSPLPEARSLNKRYTRVQIQSYRNGECLVPEGAKWGNGFQVITKPCYQATWWDISPGSGSILLSGTSMALDAGTGTENNEIVKIWQSYPGLFQQT